MSLSASIASDTPTSRRLRQWMPVLVVMALLALALTPGLISADRSFQISLCDDQEPLAACGSSTASLAQGGNG